MKTDIYFYLDGAVEERIPQITAHTSPLSLDTKVDDYFILRSKDSDLNDIFVYGLPDSELLSEDSIHVEAQKALGFQPKSRLFYGKSDLHKGAVLAFRNIMNYLTTNKIPLYMTAINKTGEEVLLRGYNPLTHVEIQHSKFKQTVLNLLE